MSDFLLEVRERTLSGCDHFLSCAESFTNISFFPSLLTLPQIRRSVIIWLVTLEGLRKIQLYIVFMVIRVLCGSPGRPSKNRTADHQWLWHKPCSHLLIATLLLRKPSWAATESLNDITNMSFHHERAVIWSSDIGWMCAVASHHYEEMEDTSLGWGRSWRESKLLEWVA